MTRKCRFSPVQPKFNGMVFIAGKGARFAGDIKAHTDHVLKELEKELLAAGSSMEKVLR